MKIPDYIKLFIYLLTKINQNSIWIVSTSSYPIQLVSMTVPSCIMLITSEYKMVFNLLVTTIQVRPYWAFSRAFWNNCSDSKSLRWELAQSESRICGFLIRALAEKRQNKWNYTKFVHIQHPTRSWNTLVHSKAFISQGTISGTKIWIPLIKKKLY